MQGLYEKVEAAAAYIKKAWQGTPHAGIILGTGLGSLVKEIKEEASIEYEAIPHFPKSTATSHRGRLVCGKLGGLPVMAMEGRFHMYEGYPLDQITLPVRVMKALGAKLLVVSNACGGMNPYYRSGDIMLIDDHINLLGANPLIGINDDRLGPRFPDMCQPYDSDLIERAQQIARRENIVVHRGVFVVVAGPNLETRAEYRFLRMIGADVVGMSTVPEVIVAVHAGLKTIGFSIITDMCLPDALEPADVAKIIATANAAEPKLTKLVLGVLAGEKRNSSSMDRCSTTADRVAAAVEAIRGHWACHATTAVILGTGLGELADEVAASATLSYGDILGFARSTALAHKGRLVCGELGGAPVVMLQGRCHAYEGYSLDDLTLPVRVLAALGVKKLMVTNAAGGLNPNYATGDVMLIDDHIDLMNLRGREGIWQAGSLPHGRFYDRELAARAVSAARRGDFVLHRGVYVAVSGPSYETRAEYRAFRRIGGDCVGMSTVPEVLAAASCGLSVVGLSTVTNVASPDAPKIVTAEEVVEVAAIARPRMRAIIEAVVSGR